MSDNRPTGLLWFDNSDKPWQDKVLEAAKAHERRLWLKATHCHLDPALVPSDVIRFDVWRVGEVEGIEVYAHGGIALGHLFVYHRPKTETATQRDVATSQLHLF